MLINNFVDALRIYLQCKYMKSNLQQFRISVLGHDISMEEGGEIIMGTRRMNKEIVMVVV